MQYFKNRKIAFKFPTSKEWQALISCNNYKMDFFSLLKICFLNGNLYKYASFAAQNNCRKKVMGFPITIINGFSINNIIINVLFLLIN